MTTAERRARTYRLSRARRLLNALVRAGLRLGVGPRDTWLLTVAGRRTGRPHTTPITLVVAGERYLVAPYGEVGWVRNARVSGRVTLARGRQRADWLLEPLDAADAGPVLRRYARAVRVTRPFFAARPDDPLEAFVAEADRHPVFRLRPAPPGG